MQPQIPTEKAIQDWLIRQLAEQLELEPAEIDIHAPFDSYGLSSREAVILSGDLEEWLGRTLSPTLAYEYPTIQALAQFLAGEAGRQMPEAPLEKSANEPIAIIGLGCRFPGATSPHEFWRLLRDGVDAITEAPSDRWDVAALYDPNPETPGKMNTRWGGFLEQVDQFDGPFFGIMPRAAANMDPQQRILLEVAWEALEHASLPVDGLANKRAGVFIGISTSDYAHFAFGELGSVELYTGTGNAHSVAANGLSYFLNVRGPSLAVDTACSSSLVAVHLACQSLRQGECDLALAGGVNVILRPDLTVAFSQARLMAADGRCKTFDASADGYVRSEGCGIIILKRLSAALAEGDRIMAVVRGTAMNHDGRSNGLTAPNGLSQQDVIRQALQDAQLMPFQISYVETHGTGTAIGDPIEVDALKAVLLEGRAPSQPCALASVKTNIGHLEAAAGIAGLIKTVLALQHKQIPPHLHLKTLNPHITLEGTPFFVPTKSQPWVSDDGHLFAGVSSFGFGGTNAHVVLEEWPAPAPASNQIERPYHLLPLSAKSQPALVDLARHYAAFLDNPSARLGDVCFTASTGRSHFAYRLAAVGSSAEQLRERLAAFAEERDQYDVLTGHAPGEPPQLAFLFSGGGSQYPGMGRQLYDTQPIFRQVIDDCDALLRPYLDQPLLSVLYPTDDAPPVLHEIMYTLPALFALEYALAELWRAWGIAPSAVMGHSLGEYAAACVAGAFSLEDGLRLCVRRGQLMQSLPEGMMAAVLADEVRVSEAIAPHQAHVAIAAINGPKNIVISGAHDAAQAVLDHLQAAKIAVQPLKVSHASHSPLMAPILDEFERAARQTRFAPLQIPLVSNLTGQVLPPGEILDANYWRRHLRETVQFKAGVKTLVEAGMEIFVELGPMSPLLAMGKRCAPEADKVWLPSLARGENDWRVLLNSLGQLFARGAPIDWKSFYRNDACQLVTLPTCAFQHKRYWVKPSLAGQQEMVYSGNKTQVASSGQPPSIGTRRTGFVKKKTDTRASEQASQQRPKRKDQILSILRSMAGRLMEIDPAEIDVHTPFLEMGADSIVLVNATRAVQDTFDVELSIRQLFEEFTTFDALAIYLDQKLPPEVALADQKAPQQAALPHLPLEQILSHLGETGQTQWETGAGVEQLMAHQLDVLAQVISQQLHVLEQSRPDKEAVAAPPVQPVRQKVEATTASQSGPAQASAWHPAELTLRKLTPQQQCYLDALAARYTQRTLKSKQLAHQYRPIVADIRSSMGFRLETKEMCYPIVGERSLGAKIWDVDGNEYIDVTMGFGVNLFGHGAAFVEEALVEQLKQGIQVGPQSKIACDVAESLRQLTGVERVAFCNSGTEAVMTALRLARAATGRSKIALFSGSYHGHSDSTLVVGRMLKDECQSMPMVPGVPPSAADQVLVLNYGDSRSLDVIKARAQELAAVLVEPVQSRRPDLQPQTFLQDLRRLTIEAGIVLIFDEIITGFRIHPGGAQAHFGIEADLVTYGKVIGGGMPIGLVAGKVACMDGIDGGLWRFGDESYPQAPMSFVAGTFCRHPLAMAAARAVLSHLKAEGPALQERLNQRTAQLAEALNEYFEQKNVPVRVAQFSSIFRFAMAGNFSYQYQPLEMDMLFYNMVDKGIYLWEGRTCFLSTAHTNQDLDHIIQAVKDSVEEMQAGGFWTEPPDDEKRLAQAESTSIETIAQIPLNEAQKQLWLLAKMGQDSALAYNVSVSLQLRGSFNPEAMRAAVRRVVNAHQSLRTTIGPQGDVQHISPRLELDLEMVDFSAVDESELDARLAEWFDEENHRPFDLVHGPLFRAHALRLKEQLYLLVLSTHHIVADGWAIGVILQDLGAAYSAACQGSVCQLDPPMQFGQYLRWQAQQLQTQEMAAHESYWLEQFASSIPVLNLPTDHPRPPFKTYKGGRRTIKLEPALCHAVEKMGQAHGCTLFMTLLAAYTSLLHRLTGQTDMVVGIPTGGRSLEGSERLVGYCAHLLPIRSQIERRVAFGEHLLNTRSVLLSAFQHQDYPFARLINKLDIPPDTSRSPLVTLTFNMERPVDMPPMFGLEAELYPRPISFAAFDISLNAIKLEGELVLDCDFNSDLFEVATIDRFLARFRALLEAVVANPQRQISELPLATEAERHQLLVEWNDTQSEYPRDQCIHQLFEAQVEQTPDAVAVVSDSQGDSSQNQHVTYGELNRRANQLARRLRALGVKPETLVGVFLERSVEMVIGLLAILKTGGAFVPLAPEYPRERQAFMLEDTGASVLLTQQSLTALLPQLNTRVLCLDADWGAVATESSDNLDNKASADNLAYVMYTSGSTGRPKGVAIAHRGLVNLVMWHQRTYHVTPADRATQLASSAFDASGWEIWPYLAAGASLYIVDDETRLHPSRLVEQMAAQKITLCFLPTPLAEMALLECWPADTSLRFMFTGGDKLHKRPGEALPFCLVNHYGPTENTIVATGAAVAAGINSGAPPIGKPIANTQVYLLDACLRPVLVGVVGELYVGGDGLARGYLKRAEMTAERFVPNPFGGEGTRLYKTGDLARYLPDGNLEFVGRTDAQVKIRGFRIEPGEIETVLGRHPAVRAVAVAALAPPENEPNQSKDKRLIAFLVARSEQKPTPSQLRDHARASLPDYMLPASFIFLDELPLTPNGKVDYGALPSLGELHPEPEAAYVAPQTELERTIAQIWQTALGAHKVGVNDNFFEMGGHSLLMAQVHATLQEALGRDLPIVEMFRCPTISSLARYLQQDQEGSLSAEKVLDHAHKQIKAIRQQKQRRVNLRSKQVNE